VGAAPAGERGNTGSDAPTADGAGNNLPCKTLAGGTRFSVALNCGISPSNSNAWNNSDKMAGRSGNPRNSQACSDRRDELSMVTIL
jgi:hypothetical protein